MVAVAATVFFVGAGVAAADPVSDFLSGLASGSAHPGSGDPADDGEMFGTQSDCDAAADADNAVNPQSASCLPAAGSGGTMWQLTDDGPIQ
ncbi:hypothetical protein [Speluncibacter jeojiensis]|uniref:Secreted protein n=1 Tax=Speluncibacter jeojiensis TaxID=2710754 RepID=A0A9X4M1P5_9ACTN|nr:hypothetical protein [Corynebacteriales bacterium D3-21]